MEFFPAIDILDGKVVRLKQGDYDQVSVYGGDPASVARDFRQAGARWIHVVDLNGARGQAGINDQAIAGILSVEGMHIEVGGGVRSLERIEQLASLGVERIVLGTRLARDPAFARQAGERFGNLLVAGVDARDGVVAVSGWEDDDGLSADDLLATLKGMGYRHVVYTDIARDGMQTGIDPDLYRHVAQVAGFPVVVSGGVASLADIESAAALGPDVVEGVIAGRAIYEGAFTVEQALAACAGKEA
jgi:phosphoribosylformimino-5-aminoimidazole carboxamide ribotide isomerase